MSKITLTAHVGSVIVDKNYNWEGYYEVTVWHDGQRHRRIVTFEDVVSINDIPVQGDGVAVEFDTETKEITIL